jgi:probable HAF family extracellular repeat protein
MIRDGFAALYPTTSKSAREGVMTTRIAIRRTWGLVLGVLLVPSIASSSLASPYKVTPLSGYGAHHLNNLGQVSGSFRPDGGDHEHNYSYTYFYDSNPGGKTAVAGITLPNGGNPGGYDFGSEVSSLNNQGQALASVTGGGTVILDAKTGQATPVAIPAGYWPQTIDDSGRIYGSYTGPPKPGGSPYHPFVYENGKIQLFDLPPGTTSASVIDANNAGQALVYGTDGTSRVAFLHGNGTWTKLGDFIPTRINDRGDVMGIAVDTTPSHPILIPHGTTPPINLDPSVPVPSPYGIGPYSFSMYGINNQGEIVGQLAGDGHGFLYKDGVMTDLNTLIDAASGWVISAGLSINDRGQILATASDGPYLGTGANGPYVLLTPDGLPTPPDMVLPQIPPVPEPSTYIIFGVLAAGFAWRRSRS